MKKIINNIYDFYKKNRKEIIQELIVLTVIFTVAFVKLPYVIYRPGGSINLNDRIEIKNKSKSKGSYSMNYVSASKANIPNILLALLIKDWDIMPEQKVTYEGTDYETTYKIEQLDYKNSIDIATLVAYQKAGIEIESLKTKPYVINIDNGADTDIKLFDEILKINDIDYNSLENLREYISSFNIGDEIRLTVKNNNKEYTRTAKVYNYNNQKIIGVVIMNDYDFETNPKINVKTRNSEAGSSGGLMLSLAIYDTLVDEDLTHGLAIMGTGTMDSEGKVGEIGGIKYKLLGAQKDHADIFFVPKDNYDEALKVYQKYNLNFSLIQVNTFDDAVNYLNSID